MKIQPEIEQFFTFQISINRTALMGGENTYSLFIKEEIITEAKSEFKLDDTKAREYFQTILNKLK